MELMLCLLLLFAALCAGGVAGSNTQNDTIAQAVCKPLVARQTVTVPYLYEYDHTTATFTCWEGSEAYFVKVKDLTVREKSVVKVPPATCESTSDAE